jgi:hypothetical protein
MSLELSGQPRLILILLLGFASIFIVGPQAGAAEHTIAPAQLETIVRNAKVIRSGATFTTFASGSEVLVWTNRNPRATDNDLKIEAVFIARAVIEKFPKQINNVKVLYSQNQQNGQFNCSQVAVTADNVKSFSSHRLTSDQLLQSLEITPAQGLDPGPYKEKRLELLGRIDNLREQGTGVLPFEAVFKQIGDMAGTDPKNENKILETIKYLSEKLAMQEQLVSLARQNAAGHHVPASSVSYTSSPERASTTGKTSDWNGSAGKGSENWQENGWNQTDLECFKKLEANIQKLGEMGENVDDWKREQQKIKSMVRYNPSEARCSAEKLHAEVEQHLQKCEWAGNQ